MENGVVTAVLAGVPELAIEGGGVEIDWVTVDGESRRSGLDAVGSVAFEDGLPVRRFFARKGQRHLSGRWWCATTGRHVGFESWLERDHAMLLDFDSSVVGIAAQPFWLSWPNESGARTRHAPDFFARRADGSGLVVDCRPVERRPREDLVKFAATERVCAWAGWEYRVVAGVEAVLAGNLRWLAGYRHPRHDVAGVAALLGDVFARPAGLMEGAGAAGDPIAVLPVLFHLLWRQVLSADLSRPFGDATRVVRADAW